MKFLIDENLSMSCARILQSLGYDALHVTEVGLGATGDGLILQWAEQNGYTIITFDLDFSRLVAIGNLSLPSIITFRFEKMTLAVYQLIMEQHLKNLLPALTAGAMVTITKVGIRIRKLPVR